jgi:hypothetical protein
MLPYPILEEEEAVFSLAGSCQRAETLNRALAEILLPSTLDLVVNSLNQAMVLNPDTVQQMVFCPGRGEVKVWRKAES